MSKLHLFCEHSIDDVKNTCVLIASILLQQNVLMLSYTKIHTYLFVYVHFIFSFYQELLVPNLLLFKKAFKKLNYFKELVQ